MDRPEENTVIEALAAQTILQRGVKVKIRAPWCIRWFKKTIPLTLTSPYEGTMVRVSRYYLGTGLESEKLDKLTLEEALATMAVHGKAISRAVACAVLNGYWSGKLFTRALAWYLRWNMKPEEMFSLTTALMVYGGTADFINTTRLVRQMKMSTLTPRLGQKTKGS